MHAKELLSIHFCGENGHYNKQWKIALLVAQFTRLYTYSNLSNKRTRTTIYFPEKVHGVCPYYSALRY